MWKDIEGYEGIYKVSDKFEIKSLSRRRGNGKGGYIINEKMKKLTKSSTGYWTVRLWKNGKSKLKLVHRLVAIAFLPNPECKPEINHKTGDTLSKDIKEIERSTHSENQKHSYRKLGRVHAIKTKPEAFKKFIYSQVGNKGIKHWASKPVIQKDITGKVIKHRENQSLAAKELKIAQANINKCLNGERNTSGGYARNYYGQAGLDFS